MQAHLSNKSNHKEAVLDQQELKLDQEELVRYDRHIRLADFGEEKQLKLKQSRVLIVGAGGLGCPIALYLAAAGIGRIGIADGDIVEVSNLQRQIAFSINDLGKPKASVLAEVITQLNPCINAIPYTVKIDVNNIEAVIGDFDLIIDGTDNFAARFLLADVSHLHKKAYLHASVHQYQGQISLFIPDKTPCFRCLYRLVPSSALAACSEVGILGIVTGAIGTITAMEAVKHLSQLGQSIAGNVLIYDALKQESKKYKLEYDTHCPLCSKNATIKNLEAVKNIQPSQSFCTTTSNMTEDFIITPERVKEMLGAQIAELQPILLDVRETNEYEQGHLNNALSLPLSIIKSRPINQWINLITNKKEQTILCYCQKGGRSQKATELLREAGFKNTYSIKGGIEAWNGV